MRLSRTTSIVVPLAVLSCLLPAILMGAQPTGAPGLTNAATNRHPGSLWAERSYISAYHGPHYTDADGYTISTANEQGGGIKENMADKYKPRYERWKKEFLATDLGRSEWTSYAQDPHFTLTITMSSDNAEGASTGKYVWDDSGRLVAATITLGTRIDEGYPNPIYYPVMNSLMPVESSYRTERDTLAATKIAHEFGHVNRTAVFDSKLYQLQSRLIPVYNKIFMTNGRNIADPQLIDLVRQIGGTPVEIWEDREYWGETNAMRYLSDRFTEQGLRCSLFSRIKRSVDMYAKSYEERFVEIARSGPFQSSCAW